MDSLNPILTKKEIEDQLWLTLQSMWDPETDNQLFIEKESDYGYLHLTFQETDKSEPISDKKAKLKIKQAVEQCLKDHQMVFLYYCPDNGEIGIEHLDEDDDWNMFHKISENYYEGKD